MTEQTQLHALVAVCGGVGQCAFLLGLSRNTVSDFLNKRGRISVIGALLVSHSKFLSPFFTKEQLLPRCNPVAWRNYERHKFFKAARKAQKENEKSIICESLPPAILLKNTCQKSKK